MGDPGKLFCIALALFGLLAIPFAKADPGVTEGRILLGTSLPLSGVLANVGNQAREGMLAYVQQINAAGGINGRKLELVALDDGYDPARAAANTRKLIEENRVFALMTYVGTASTLESMKVFAEAKVPLIGTITGADGLRQPVNRYLFHLRASYADEAEAMVRHLSSLGTRNFAVFYQNDPFGKSGLEGVNRALRQLNLNPVALGTVERNTVAVEQAVAAIAKANPQAVIMITTAKPIAAFVKQMRQAGQLAQLNSISTGALELLVQELGPEARGIGITQVMPYPGNDALPVVKDYQKGLYASAKHRNLSYYGLEAYLSMKLLADALKRSGKEPSREKLVTTLETMGETDLGGFRLSYSPTDHSGSHFVDLTVIGKDGKLLR